MTGDVKQRFSQYAHGYVTSETHSQGHDLDRLIELAQPQSDWVVLDVATGGGHTALKFAPHVAKVIASDFAPPMLAEAKAFIESKGVTNIEFAEVDAENMPYPDATFDLVTCRVAPHHFADAFKFVQEAARVLRAGGRVVLVEDFDALERRAPDANPLALLRGWLADAGLACDRLRPFDVSGAHLLLAAAVLEPEAAAA